MAIIRITWNCGHDDAIRAKSRDQAYWERRAATEPCRDCWHEQRNQEAADAAKTQDLPVLTGTPRQISWAETLRQALLTQVATLEATISATDPNRPTWDRLVRKLRIQSKASWWIDQRGSTPLDIFRRWERERLEAERLKPVAELLGQQAPPTPISTARAGFSHPVPAPAPLREAAQDAIPPIAGYDPTHERKLSL